MVTKVQVCLIFALTLGFVIALTSAAGGRDFHYKTWQTHPHHGHSDIYHEQHIPHGHHHDHHHHHHGQ